MSDEERDRAFEAFVAGRSPALLRTAYLVTGDESGAQLLLRDALATTYLSWNRIEDREGVEEYVRRVMLTAHASSPALPATATQPASRDTQGRIWAGLRELTPRERSVLVLAVRDQLDDDEIARVLTCARRTVQADGTHAAIVVREAVNRPMPVEATETDGQPSESPAEQSVTMAGLDAAIRATLTARADDVRPAPSLVDGARDRAEQLRRERRSRRLAGTAVATGLVVVLAVVIGVVDGRSSGSAAQPSGSPQHSEPPFSSPAPTSPSGSVSGGGLPGPAASVIALPDSVLTLAHDNDALLAYGSAIVDSASGTALVSVETDPATGASTGERILALARVTGGYAVLTGADDDSGPEPLTLSYVRPDGSRVELGRVAVATSGFAVSPDGLSVVHVIKGPQKGENAIAAGQSELVVQTLGGDVVNRVMVTGDVLPVSVTDSQVVFRRLDVSATSSYVWDRTRDAVNRLDVPADQLPLQIHDTRVLLRSTPKDGCVLLGDVQASGPVAAVWSRCGFFPGAQFDATGSAVAAVKVPEGRPELVVLDAGTGEREYSSQLGRGFPFQLQWTAVSQKVLVATADRGVVTYTSIAPGTGGLVVTSTYEVPEGPVVLGVELPLPAG